MNSNDRIRFMQAITALAEYYEKELSDGAIGLYWQGLESYTISAVERAIGQHLQNPDTGQWMPKIADVVRMIEGTTQDAAAMAWAKVMQAVGSVGQYQSLAFDDPVIHLTIEDLGGWPGICQTIEDELPFLQKRFETAYRAYRRRGSDIPQHPRYLAGISEISNTGRGYASPPPRLVGDQDRAKAVMLGGATLARLQVSPAQAVVSHLKLLRSSDAA